MDTRHAKKAFNDNLPAKEVKKRDSYLKTVAERLLNEWKDKRAWASKDGNPEIGHISYRAFKTQKDNSLFAILSRAGVLGIELFEAPGKLLNQLQSIVPAISNSINTPHPFQQQNIAPAQAGNPLTKSLKVTQAFADFANRYAENAVSYTHLTLPTICSV